MDEVGRVGAVGDTRKSCDGVWRSGLSLCLEHLRRRRQVTRGREGNR